jgi:hypothetical protein
MKELLKNKYVLLALSIILLIATNPNERKHVDAVEKEVIKLIKEKQLNPAIEALSYLMIQPLLTTMARSDSYLIVSFTEVKWQGEYKTVGIGILGKVYIFNSRFNEYLN